MTLDEIARQIVDTTWAEFTNTVGPSTIPLHPEMRALMMALVTSGMKVEREACAKILDREDDECEWYNHSLLGRIAEEIRARGEGEREEMTTEDRLPI